MLLDDATALVTGASGGIGAAVATGLHGRNRKKLADVAARIGDARIVVGDLAEPDGPGSVAQRTGPVDVLVHCAGVGLRGTFAASDSERVDELITVDLRAPLLLTRALLPAMCAAHRGHIAFVASIAGLTGVGREAVYAAAKAGLLTFAESLRFELAGSGVTVSTISPGAVDTGFWNARGEAYHRSTPRPIGADNVADVLLRDIEHGRSDRVLPRWLGVAPALRSVAPRLYRNLALRMDGRGDPAVHRG